MISFELKFSNAPEERRLNVETKRAIIIFKVSISFDVSDVSYETARDSTLQTK